MPPQAARTVYTPEQRLHQLYLYKDLRRQIIEATTGQALPQPLLDEIRTQQLQRQTVVRFELQPQVREMIHINDLRKEADVSKIWYSSDDYRRIAMECEATVRRMRDGRKMDDERYCSRGLENWTLDREWQLRQNISAAAHALFTEQRLQWEEGIHDVEFLADTYFEHSYRSQVESHERGLYDCEVVRVQQREETRVFQLISDLSFLSKTEQSIKL